MRKTILIFVLGSLFSANAQAQDRVFAALTGHGFEDIYNFGFGIRIGKSFSILNTRILYLGGIGIYHQGKTQNREFTTASGNEIIETTNNVAYFGGEVGININAKVVTFRPSLFLAYARVSKDIPQLDGSSRFVSILEEVQNEFFLGPGMNIAIPFGNMSLGGDIRYLDVKTAGSWAIYSTLSFRF